MSLLSGVTDFFGLDIGTNAIRVVQLRGSGPVKTLERYGQVPVDIRIAMSDSKGDQKRLADSISQLINQVGIATKNVAVGLPSSRVFTTVLDMDRLPPEEMGRTIRYQADSFIPTPLAESKIDWAVIGDSPVDPAKVELLLSSISNTFVESRLDMLESIGLNVVAFEPENMALARAVIAPDTVVPQMALEVGNDTTDLVIAMNGAPHLTRSIPIGTHAIINAAVQSLNIDAKQAEQFVYKFGLTKSKLEGQIYEAIISTVDGLVSEMEKSLKFFQNRYPNMKLDRIIVTGGAASLPELPVYIANKFGITVEIGNAWRNVSYSPGMQNELMAAANHFSVAAGLAERN